MIRYQSQSPGILPSNRSSLWTWLVLPVALMAFSQSACSAQREGTGDRPGDDSQVLSRIQSRVDSLLARNELPILILDIDGTLLDPAARHQEIFLAYATEQGGESADLEAKIMSLALEDYAYAPDSNFALMGITDADHIKKMKTHWVANFFANTYLDDDLAILGGAAFVEGLWEQGAFIAYLTGRDSPRMLEGTVASLRDRGYPVSRPRVSVILKPNPKMKDFDFKGLVLDQLDAMGTVIAVFENEPKNLNLMADRFPQAEAVFLDSNHSPNAVPVDARASWIRSYESK